MSPSYSVSYAQAAGEDLARLLAYLIDKAKWQEDLDQASITLATLESTIEQQLSTMPWAFRKAGDGSRSTRRELVVTLGHSGYVVLYEIVSAAQVLVLAVRHQLEEDYH